MLDARLDEIAALAGARRSGAGAPARSDQGAARRTGRDACWKRRDRFDPDRLHQEAILLASKADIREELDRLAAHVAQARKLLADGGPVGRRLDFLSQELNREIEYAVRQGERRRTDQYRARAQERGRAVPRAGAEPGVTMAAGRKAETVARRGMMLVLSSPSGAGKTTLSRRLLRSRSVDRAVGFGDDAAASGPARSTAATIISSTARALMRWCASGELLEWAEVFGHCYGTPREPVEAALDAGP